MTLALREVRPHMHKLQGAPSQRRRLMELGRKRENGVGGAGFEGEASGLAGPQHPD